MICVILTLLLLSTCIPPIQGLTDEVLMPKWYGAVSIKRGKITMKIDNRINNYY